MNGPQIFSQHSIPAGLPQPGILKIQQELQFPLGKCVPPGNAADQILHQTVKRGPFGTFCFEFVQVVSWLSEHKSLRISCE